MSVPKKTPLRSEVDAADKWNLSRLYDGDAAWERGLSELSDRASRAGTCRAAMGASAEGFLAALAGFAEYGILDERVGSYAHLRVTEDEGDSVARGRYDRYVAAATIGEAAWSWFRPEVQALPAEFVDSCARDPRFADYRVFIGKLLRYKPHILSGPEERILALQKETAQTARDTFGILTNVDLDFGSVETQEGPRVLTQSSFASLLRHRDRGVRKAAYTRLYDVYGAHAGTIASLYSGSVKLDRFEARVRNFPDARARALFPDDVPAAVYDSLVDTVNANLPALHDYYDLRAEILGLDELRHYDVYVPIVPETKSTHTFGEAVDTICAALAPLGDEYVSTLRSGLTGGWVDRYENRGKRSGAFSAGCYSGEPYILMNYKEDVLRDLFTLAHEGGHSMHSWYSVASNPFTCYDYTIFEAEVASTFNEQLVFRHLLDRAGDRRSRSALLANWLDDTLATLYRQTMFAEYERRTHEMLEAGEALTLDALRAEYRKLLVRYFGPRLRFEESSDLEGLRIPHFYNAFYVYKYATGVSAAIALSGRVLAGGAKEREDYFTFLKSGGSRFPIEALKVAGVDMSSPAPVRAACAQFAEGVRELRSMLGK